MKITSVNYKEFLDRCTTRLDSIECGNDENSKKIIKEIGNKIQEVTEGCSQLQQENSILNIGVVGQVKAGKSSFLNSLFFGGENVLPRASTPMTAGLTVLRYAEENRFEVEYYNKSEWQTFVDDAAEYDSIVDSVREQDPKCSEKEAEARMNIPPRYVSAKELVSKCSRKAITYIEEKSRVDSKNFSDIHDLQEILGRYVGAEGDFTPIVKSLVIYMNDPRLEGIQIVDTPGVNDPVLSREQRTKTFLQGCHGVFFLSYSARFFDSTDVGFLCNRIGDNGIGTVVLIASKFDSVLQDVGMKFHDDLMAAIEDCQKKLKQQMRNNISNSDYKGKDPILDFSSGIGYSIYKKNDNQRDDIEQNVVKQMKNFYPSFFSSEEDVKDTFLNLSQIDDIHKNYVEKVFKQNKEKIIQEKVDAYFANVTTMLQKELKQKINNLKGIIDALNKNDVDSLRKQRESTEKTINSVKNEINHIVKTVDTKADKMMKECLNKWKLSQDNIPTIPVDREFLRTSTSWLDRNKKVRCTVDVPNIDAIITSLKNKFDDALSLIEKEWNARNQEIQKLINDNINEVINTAEINDEEGAFDAKMLRNLIHEVIDTMSNEAILNINSLKEKFKESLFTSLQGKDRVNLASQKKETEVETQNRAREVAADVKSSVRIAIDNICSSIYKDLEKELKKSRESSISCLKDRKKEFIEEIQKGMRETLDNLERELVDKENSLNIKSETLKQLETINSEL